MNIAFWRDIRKATMKKCGIFAIAALMTILCGRLNAAVESEIVGYTTTTIQGKKVDGSSSWYQIAIQFKGLGETEDKIKLGEAIDAQGLTPTAWRQKASAPCIQVYNGTGYDYYYYTTQARTTDGSLVTGWANALQELASNVYFNVGDALWFKADNILADASASITTAGTVSLAQSETEIEIASNGLNLIASPYPMAVVVNDIGCSFAPIAWRNKSNGVCIQVYNGTGYDYYYYTTQARTTDGSLVTGWANALQELATTEIPAGVGFWVKTPTNQTGTLTFSLN